MRTWWAGAVLVLLLPACAADARTVSGPTARAENACAAPPVEVSPAQVRAGGTVRVLVSGLVDGCADSIGVDENGRTTSETVTPRADVPVVLAVGGRSVQLGVVDAAADGDVDVELVVPRGTPAGTGTVSVSSAGPAALVVLP